MSGASRPKPARDGFESIACYRTFEGRPFFSYVLGTVIGFWVTFACAVSEGRCRMAAIGLVKLARSGRAGRQRLSLFAPVQKYPRADGKACVDNDNGDQKARKYAGERQR